MKKIILSLILIIFLSGLRKFILLIIILMFTLSLSGCCSIYNLSLFTLPDDAGFLACIKRLDTPQKIGNYMLENFTYETHLYYAPNPYSLWIMEKGDCNDFATFGIFIADYHGYETYQIRIFFKGTPANHMLAVYLENDKYTYSSNTKYFPIYALTFNDIVLNFFSFLIEYELNYYEVYDYDMNLIEKN